MSGLRTGILCLTLSLAVFLQGECHILKDWENTVKGEELENQDRIDANRGCNISAGWNLTGRDLGCCGNYEGCCKMASKVCYLHDSICQCCRLGWIFCGPECKPEIDCLTTTEKSKTFLSFSPTTISSNMTNFITDEKNDSKQENVTSSIPSSAGVFDTANLSEKENKFFNSNSYNNTTNQMEFTRTEPDLSNKKYFNSDSESENQPNMSSTSAFFNNTSSGEEGADHTMGEVENQFPLLETYSRHNDIMEGSGED